jgi:hypothetical protein
MILAPPLAGILYEIDPTIIYPISIFLILLALFVSARQTRSSLDLKTA